MFINGLYCLVLLNAISAQLDEKTKLTIDEFFEYVEYPAINFSPTGHHLLIESRRASWNTESFENSLYIYDIRTGDLQLVTDHLSENLSPLWSPSGKWLAFFLKTDLSSKQVNNLLTTEMYLYSTETKDITLLNIGTREPGVYVWSNQDTTLYFTTSMTNTNKQNSSYQTEWRSTIQYRSDLTMTEIHRIDIDWQPRFPVSTISTIANVTFAVSELVYVPFEDQLVFRSRSSLYEDLENFELYSIQLRDPQGSLIRLTNNEGVEQELKLSSDGQHILFRLWALTSGKAQVTQRRLFSLSLKTGQIERLAQDFNGLVQHFEVNIDGGVYFLGQRGLQVQIYRQKDKENVTQCSQWNGSYENLAVPVRNSTGPVAFVFSSFTQPKEVYLAENINRLSAAKPITKFNQLFTQRALPQSQSYQWINTDDGQQIEGVLHFPPGINQTKNLPLLVLIHGGPHAASLNEFQANWYNWALMAATEGWMVLEPNYRGSTGYGDEFLGEISSKLLSLPGQDILMGVDQLVNQVLADSTRLAVGGYSYGGFLTNWLITQTTRFNAALSGSGDVEHVSGWGTMDLPLLLAYLHGGFPWERPDVYQNQSPIYQMNKVQTPTHIVTGEKDVRVRAEQSYMLERALHYLGIPNQLLVFTGEGHGLEKNPWSGKIKVREELKWLQRYGNEQRTLQLQNQSIMNRSFSMKFSVHLLVFISLLRCVLN